MRLELQHTEKRLSLLSKATDEKKKKMTEEVITMLECVVGNEFMQIKCVRSKQ